MSHMSDTPPLVINWFRRDLRIQDNPSLSHAIASGAPVIAVYVLEKIGHFAPGGASRWWLHHSLKALHKDLEKLGIPLVLRRGDPAKLIPELVKEVSATSIVWNRRYDGKGIETDKGLKLSFTDDGVEVKTFNGSLLREPWETETKSGGFYKVYTPFWRAYKEVGPSRNSLSKPRKAPIYSRPLPPTDALKDWALLPTKPNWAKGFDDHWTPGEKGAAMRLDKFLDRAVSDYDDRRNRPDIQGTSGLSPHLAFGEISPFQIWNTVRGRMEQGNVGDDGAMTFLSEVVWREFSYNLLYHFGHLATDPWKKEFATFPWEEDPAHLEAWQKGQTGIPIVDAGMRQLWQTGWMHNRVRMIVGSFLVKNLLIPWQEGERWFWDTLVDADPASNAASWQWVAGSGADAAPYFRIFNPVSQSQKFDPDGAYIRQYVPELSRLPNKHIHAPFEAPTAILKDAGVELGATYPEPIADLKITRQRALDAYDEIRKSV